MEQPDITVNLQLTHLFRSKWMRQWPLYKLITIRSFQIPNQMTQILSSAQRMEYFDVQKKLSAPKSFKRAHQIFRYSHELFYFWLHLHSIEIRISFLKNYQNRLYQLKIPIKVQPDWKFSPLLCCFSLYASRVIHWLDVIYRLQRTFGATNAGKWAYSWRCTRKPEYYISG